MHDDGVNTRITSVLMISPRLDCINANLKGLFITLLEKTFRMSQTNGTCMQANNHKVA